MKIVSLSISRVVATIGIVLCHICCYYTFVPGHDLLGHFFNVGVPMFIIISGYLYGKRSGGQGGILKFYMARLIKVSLPVQIFALALFAVLGLSELRHTVVAIFNLQGLNSIYPLGEFFDAGQNLSHTWFVTIIIICYMIMPLLSKVIGEISNNHILMMWLVTLALPFVGVTLQYIALFITSYYVAYNKSLKDYNSWLLLFAIVLSLVLRMVGHVYFDNTVFYTDVIVVSSHFLPYCA